MSAREQLDTLSRDDLIALVLQLQQRLAQLEARLKQNSHNSDKPPSQESPFQPRAKRPLTKRNGGGQPGHDGKGLSKVEAPTRSLSMLHHVPALRL
jgi:hypothetical protein